MFRSKDVKKSGSVYLVDDCKYRVAASGDVSRYEKKEEGYVVCGSTLGRKAKDAVAAIHTAYTESSSVNYED